MKWFPLILLGLCGCISTDVGEPTPPSAPLTDHQRSELQTLTRMLVEPDRTSRTRYEAAELLLTRPYPAAGETVVAFLTEEANRPAKIALARAIADTGLTDDAFIAPLFTMLADSDEPVRIAAAAALGAFPDGGVLTGLANLADDADTPEPTRLAAIAGLARRIDKQSIETLIDLLADPDPSVRSAALTGLQKMTGIRRFGPARRQWQAWWRANRGKPRQQWLADQIETLTRQSGAQQRRLADMHTRLDAALSRLYTATPPSNRATMVMELMREPLAEVRLSGLGLAGQRVAAGEALAEDAAPVVRALLDDQDPRVRAAAALLAADLKDPEAVELIMARLTVEANPAARTALITALGALGNGQAIDVLLTALADEPNGAAIEAALAIERLVANVQLTAEQTAATVTVITERYDESRQGQPQLRRALLSAMRAVNRAEFAPVMRSALSDPVATIRLEAIRGLQSLNVTESAADIAPLAADPDRGVRQVAIATLGALGDPAHLAAVLARTNPDAEPDPVVRQRAWDTALALMTKVDEDRLAQVADELIGRADASQYRIEILKMLADRLDASPARQAQVQLQLAEALLAAGRPAEAAGILAQAHAEAEDAQADVLWPAWMKALLAAEDAAAMTHMADQENAAMFGAAANLLIQRLADLRAAGQYPPLIRLADAAANRLGDRLGEDRLARILELRRSAAEQQQQADRAEAARLIGALAGPEEDQRSEAAAALLAMKARAVVPLIQHLGADLAAERPDVQLQDRILLLLEQLAPELTGFDDAADTAAKAKLVDDWLAQLES